MWCLPTLEFQHTAARRRLPNCRAGKTGNASFNTQPPEGCCTTSTSYRFATSMFQHTAARRRLPIADGSLPKSIEVSTHSRPKAAASRNGADFAGILGFNTQPPEGGCGSEEVNAWAVMDVSTHSRPKAAASWWNLVVYHLKVSTHSRPKAAAKDVHFLPRRQKVSTHSRPKAAACFW